MMLCHGLPRVHAAHSSGGPRSRRLAGGLLLLAAATPGWSQAAPPAPPLAPPLAGPLAPPVGQAPATTTPGQPTGAEPGADPSQPAAIEPVGPVQPAVPFEPAPLPEDLQRAQAAMGQPAGAAAPVMPMPPVTSSGVGSAVPNPVVPGAQQQGLVVADTARIFGPDAIPAYGAAVVAAAGLSASAALRINYDSNIALTPNGELPPGSPFTNDSGVILRPVLNVSAGKDVGRQLFFLNAGIGKDFYLDNPGVGRERINVNGGWQWLAGSSCSGRLQGGWSTRQTGSFDFAEFEPGSTEFANFFTSASCQFGRFVPTLTFDAGQNRFDNADQAFSNSNFWGVSGAFGYAFAPSGQAGVQVSYREASFPNQVIIPGDPTFGDNGVEVLTIAGFGSYTIRQNWSINGSVGWTKSSNRNPLLQDFSGVTGEFSLGYATQRWGASLSFGRNANLGNTGGSNLRVTTNVIISANYRITDRLLGSGGISWANWNNFSDPRYSGIEIADTRNFRANVGLGYELLPRVNIGLDYRYLERRPDVDALEPVLGTSSWNLIGSIRIFFLGGRTQAQGYN